MGTSDTISQYALNNSSAYFSLYVDGQPYPVIERPGMQVAIRQSIQEYLPTCDIVLDDMANQINSNVPINDGSLLEIKIGTTFDSTTAPKQYRAFGTPAKVKSDIISGANQFHVLGLLDAVPYLTQIPPKPVTGTSVDVFKYAAQQLGFTLVTNFDANDSMTWRPANMSWKAFLKHVADHAYSDDKGITSLGVDDQKNLHYYNVTSLITSGSPVAYLYYGANQNASSSSVPTFPCVYYKNISRAGYNNNKNAFGQNTVQPGTLGTSPDVHSTVNTHLVSKNPDINITVKNEVGTSPKTLFAPIDCGNGHENLIKARHQNIKLRSLYSQNIYVGVPFDTKLTLFSRVQFTATDGGGNIETDVSGLYIVVGMVSFIAGGRFFQKIHLCSTGPNNADTAI